MQPSEPEYPAFDTAQPTDAERIAALEARVQALETLMKKRLAVILDPLVRPEFPIDFDEP